MRLTLRRTMRKLKDTRGSAMLSVYLVLVVLIILGAGILVLSTANTQQATAADTYERAYFIADGNARQAIETIRSAALEKYRLIALDLANNYSGTNNANNFFTYINTVTASYKPFQPDSSAGGPTDATVKIEGKNTSVSTRNYKVTSTATDGSIPRTMYTVLTVTFVPVVKQGSTFTPLGDETVLCGGTFRQNTGWSAIHGTVKFGAFSSYNPYQFKLWDMDQSNTSTWIDPNTKDRLSWSMDYPGFTGSVRTPSAQLTLPAIANGTTITNEAFKDPPFNWNVPSPIYLEGQSGAAFTISNFQYKGGQIYCTGNLTITNDVLGTASSYVKIYCTGNLSISNGVVKYTQIYCGGKLTINGGDGFDHVTIYCNGSISDSCTNRSNVRIRCQSYTMNGGNFVGDNILYAENSIHLESTVSGLFYTNGAIDLAQGLGLTGQMAAKGNITVNGSFDFKPDSAMLARLNTDPFVTSSPGGSETVIIQPSDTQIFTNEPVFSEQ